VERADIKPQDVVLVSGPGPIGLLIASLAKLQGAKVVVCGLSRDERRLRVAKEMGADFALAVDQEDLIALVKDETDGYGADAVFETAGVAASVDQCLRAVAVAGTYVQFALFEEPTIPVNANLIVNKHIRLLGNYGSTWEAWGRTLKILSESGVDFSKLITARLPLTSWEEAFEAVQNQSAMKILLYPD
jgi:L-iditol 2-dehydrogenase